MITRILQNTDHPIGGYVWKAGLLSLVPSLMVGFLLAATIDPSPGPEFQGSAIAVAFGLLVVSPWIETLLMWPILWLITRFVKDDVPASVISAVIWGVLHSTAAPLWGIAVAWPFFVFSMCFLAWHRKSIFHALVVTALTHMFQNSLPTLAVLATL